MVDIWKYAKWKLTGSFRSARELEKKLIQMGAKDKRYDVSRSPVTRLCMSVQVDASQRAAWVQGGVACDMAGIGRAGSWPPQAC